MAFRKFGIGSLEVGSPVSLVGFFDAANGFVGAVVFVDNRFCSLVHDGEEGVIEVGFTVGEVMTSDREQFLVRVGEDVEPGLIGDFCAFVPDVEEGGGRRVVEGR